VDPAGGEARRCEGPSPVQRLGHVFASTADGGAVDADERAGVSRYVLSASIASTMVALGRKASREASVR